MNELTIITGKVNLDTTYLKIKISLEEIKRFKDFKKHK